MKPRRHFTTFLRLVTTLTFAAFLAMPVAAQTPGLDLLVQTEQAFVDGDNQRVLELATRTLNSDPSLADARFMRGMANHLLGRDMLALHDLNAYLQTGQNYRKEAGDMVLLLEKQLGATAPTEAWGAPVAGRGTISPDRSGTVNTAGILDSMGPVPGATGEPKGITGDAGTLPLRYTFSAGVHYDDRVVLRPDDTGALDPIEDSAVHLRANVDLSPREGGYILRYDGDAMLYNEAERERRLAQKVEAGWHTTFDGSKHDLELVGIADLILLDWEEYRRRFGGAMTWQYFDNHRTWAKVKVGDDAYDEFSDYDGNYWGAEAGQDYILGDWILSWAATYLDQSAQLPEVEFTERTLSLSALYNLSDTLSVGAGVAFIDNPYDRFDPVFEQVRKDDLRSGQAFLRYKLTDNLSLEPSITFIQRESSVSDLDYDRFIAEINAVWSHF